MTLYHWELPQAAEDRGGWCSEETAHSFARFAGMMASRFRGRVRHYFTLNEPQCTTSLGYQQGIHAPGHRLELPLLLRIHVNQMMAHGLAQRAIKAADPEAMVGIASTGNLCYPESETAGDIAAARRATFAVSEENWIFTHQWLLDPIVLGRFPDCAGTALEPLVQEVRTALKWPVTPEVLDWGVRFLQERYGLPGYITENGLSCNDRIYLDGKVHDPDRIDFLTRYLSALSRAVESGADIRGYFHWSTTDNLEWHSGYGERFGLIYIDFPSGQRIPKDSFYWYQKLIRSGVPENCIE